MVDNNGLVLYVNNARAAGYSSQQIIECVEATGDIAATHYVANYVQQIEFQNKLIRTTVKYNQGILYQSIYNAVLSGTSNDDILNTCGEYCDLEDYAFCKLALQHILVNRVPSQAEIAVFVSDLKYKFNNIDDVFKIIESTVNLHFLSLIRKAFIDYIYGLYLQGKSVDYFLSLANKCGNIVIASERGNISIADCCRRVADKVSIQKYGTRLDINAATQVLLKGVNDNTVPASETRFSEQPVIDEAGKLLVQVLSDFNIKAELVGAVSGPTFNRIEVKLGRGVKFSTVANFSDDLMQQLGDELGIDKAPMISSIRGRTAFDIPRLDRQIAYFRDYVDFSKPIDIGRIVIPGGINVNGRYFEINFCDDNSPHIMGGGCTGSGKSQFLKSAIMYLARRYPPSLVRLALSDVKRVTFGKFQNLPHLIGDVCKDASTTADMLEYLVVEMELRYIELEKYKDSGIENINQYNKLHLNNHVMPRIICLIDETSDLVSVEEYVDRIENSLASLLRKARAVGIHVGAYTQRPDKDSVKPQIRSNFPAKTGFAVTRIEDSGIVLGDSKDWRCRDLLGRGDFIFRTPEVNERLQALFLDDADDIEYFNQLMEEILNANDPFTAWESEVSFEDFMKQLYLNKQTVDPNTVDRIVSTSKYKTDTKPKVNVDSSFAFNIQLDARAKDSIQTLWCRSYSVDQITTEVFGKSKGGRDADRKFDKQKKVIEKYINELNSDDNDEEVDDNDL